MECKVLSYKGSVFSVEPPNFVELQVTTPTPALKGDTATNATKPATLETGAEIRVPLSYRRGEMIRVIRAPASMGARKGFPKNCLEEAFVMTITERLHISRG